MAANVNIVSPGPALELADIAALEKEIGSHLPDDYKQFLLKHNGGLVDPTLGFNWEGKRQTIGSFDSLLPTSDHGIRRALRDLRELGADGYLPVTSTYNDQDVCLAFRGQIGAVFFTLYTYKTVYISDLVPIAVKKMVPLADSFTELLNILFEIPDPFCPIEDLGKRGTPDELANYLAAGNSIETEGKNKLRIVLEAIKFKNVSMIQACVQRGASLSGTIDQAVGNGHIDLIELLVAAGADINERDEYGRTPLHSAIGTALPGEEGERNRAMKQLLEKLGAVR